MRFVIKGGGKKPEMVRINSHIDGGESALEWRITYGYL